VPTPRDKTDNDQLWRGLLTGENSPIRHDRGQYKRVPGFPRCKMCLYPLGGLVARLLRVKSGRGPSRKNPNYCNICEEFVRTHPGGAEVEISLLFADVRGSTPLAERLGSREFTALMNRFFRVSTQVVIESDGLVDNFVGDEIVGLYLPMMVADHPSRAIESARKLLLETGHADDAGPWLPVGVGVHTGEDYVGSVGDGTVADFTAMGDACNVTARLSSAAAAGEILVTEKTWTRSALHQDAPTRRLELKGKSMPVDVHVLDLG
jgi:adenylate cyclase